MPRRRKLPSYLRDAELAGILASATSHRDRCILLLGLYCGLRVSEISRLRVADLDLNPDEPTLFVNQGKGGKDRYVPVPARILGDLRSLVENRRGWVFPSPRTPGRPLAVRTIFDVVRGAAREAGIERRTSPHVLRHTYATRLLDADADLLTIKDLLGHASVATTQIYAHVSQRRARRAVDSLG